MVSTNSTTTVDLNESRAGKITPVIIFCPALALVIVALRLYSRFVLGKRRFSEDYFIVLAMIFSIGVSLGLGIAVLFYGLGRHVQAVPPKALTKYIKVGTSGRLFYQLTQMFMKVSISLQYLRISVMRFEKQLCYVLICFVVSQGIAYFVLAFTLCTPFKAIWNRHMPGAKCVHITAAYYVGICVTIAMDFAILLLPVFILRHLTLRWYQKLVIAIVLAFGGLACIFSVLRFTSVRASTKATDITWDQIYTAIYGTIEINTGIICSSIVTLKPLFQRHFPFLVRWLDAVGDRHVSMASWRSNVGPDLTTPPSNTIESKQYPKSVMAGDVIIT
ncbi:hypothetical protein DM02DRAFT_733331 [Periconia macrospinosa]|uniref:Rhodopsin domain-containing protein n=1 Tax=Periconia macrospinosa TaxID=97972 RepID=A0A2V1D500_9PLEO|nr:hypothetical protein DM02DRAFT_733331 [Periconia macrospinosa]